MELHPWKISVSLIEAGAVATPIWEKSLRQADDLNGQVAPENYALGPCAAGHCCSVAVAGLGDDDAPFHPRHSDSMSRTLETFVCWPLEWPHIWAWTLNTCE